MNFYENINNTSIFDKIYNSRVDMENDLENDQIFVGRYILIVYDDNMDQTSLDYTTNWDKDKNRYGSNVNYDGTIWQKVISNGDFKYVLITNIRNVFKYNDEYHDIQWLFNKVAELETRFNASATDNLPPAEPEIY